MDNSGGPRSQRQTGSDSDDLVRYEVDRAVATLTLNRPERLNSLGTTLRRALHTALARADSDDDIRCVVLTGAGRAFSSGADLGDGGSVQGGILASYAFGENPYGDDASLDVRSMRKPVIAAVNGICYGAGMIYAAECDLLVAAESAQFSMIEARMGHGGSSSLPYRIGAQWTNFLMFTGEIIDAHKAKEIGLVLEVVGDDELLDRVHDLAVRIAAMPRYQVMFSKRQTNGTLAMMGYEANRVFSQPNQAILTSLSELAAGPDGRLLQDILREDGFQAFKAARDAAHTQPWLR